MRHLGRIMIGVCLAAWCVAAQPDPRTADRRLREWHEVVDAMSETERIAFLKLPAEEQGRTVRELVTRRRAREEAAFLMSLPDAVRAEVDAMPPARRRARIIELRIGQKLERVVVDAWDLGVIDGTDAAEALDLEKPADQAARILELQKVMFIQIHDEHIRRFPPHLQRNLAAMPPREFFRHGAVQDVRIRHHFSIRAINRLRRDGERAIEKFLDALTTGELGLEQRGCFRPDGLVEFEKLDAEGRRSFVAQMRRTHFFRELKFGRKGPREGRRPGMEAVELPPELFDRLDPREQDMWLSMPSSARRAFAQHRFPIWWQHEGPVGPRPREHTLRQLVEGLEKLSEAERQRLLDRPLTEAMQKILGPPPRRGGRGHPPRDGRGRPPRVDIKKLVERLSPEDRARFEKLPERARRPFLQKHFPEEFRRGRR